MDATLLLVIIALVALVIALVLLGVVLSVLHRQGRMLQELESAVAASADSGSPDSPGSRRAPDGDAGAEEDSSPRKVVVVLNPTHHPDPEALRERLRSTIANYGGGEAVIIETTAEDSGRGQAQQAIDDGADMVIAAGGDGTVRLVAAALAGSGVQMGILPMGTGNLLARNLDLPLDDPEAAMMVALTGTQQRVDIGWLRVSDSVKDLEVAPRHAFLVIAGIGADAEIIGATTTQMKRRIGWIAYVLAGMKSVIGHSHEVHIDLPGAVHHEMRARTVLVGNVGKLPGGITLMPGATIDNRKLEILALNWRGAAGLSQIITQLVNPRLATRPKLSTMQRYMTTSVSVTTSKAQPVQMDGDTLGEATHIAAEVDPGALLMRVPRGR